MNAFIDQVSIHHEVIAEFLIFAAFAAASTMPKPGTWQGFGTLYAWFFNFVQEMISMRSAKLASGTEPQVRTSVPVSSTLEEQAPAPVAKP